MSRATVKAQRLAAGEPGWMKGAVPESWCCVDCGVNTAPGAKSRVEFEQAFKSQCLSASGSVSWTATPWSELYTVLPSVWKAAGMKPWGGCPCIGCLEKRLGRRLRSKDFPRNDPFNWLPGTVRLLSRREENRFAFIDHADGLFVVIDGKATTIKTMEEGEKIIRETMMKEGQ
jgi:hypothetical protein